MPFPQQSPGKYLLVTPTLSEYLPVRLALKEELRRGRWQLGRCGMGVERARAFCTALESDFDMLLLLGWAGGLSPELKAGDVVGADAAWMEGLPPLTCDLPGFACAAVGPILTAPQILATQEAKARARQEGALAVEMEAYPLAEWAQVQGIPFMHVRVILDTASEPLPAIRGLRAFHPANLLAIPALAHRVWSLSRVLRRVAHDLARRRL